MIILISDLIMSALAVILWNVIFFLSAVDQCWKQLGVDVDIFYYAALWFARI